MKYDLQKFDSAVSYYREKLGNVSKKAILVVCQFENTPAFYSIAPLSRAANELGGELNVIALYKKSKSFEVLVDVWKTFDELKSKKNSAGAIALKEFIESVNAQTKNRDFEKIFEKPDKLFIADFGCFISINFDSNLEYKTEWLKKRKWPKLLETTERILRYGYALKKNEHFSVGFELIPSKKNLELPLEDYLDNFSIALAFGLSALKFEAIPVVGSSTSKQSQLEPMNRISELSATLIGCEAEKEINLKIFKKFKKLSKLLKINRMTPNDAAIAIVGKGYSGKHFFGTRIGYPTPNLKSKWSSPGQMFLKTWSQQQTALDNRNPKMRYAITETLPIENFVRTCDISFDKMRKTNGFIQKIIDKSEKLAVIGEKINGLQTDLEVFLDKKGFIWESDSDVRNKLNLKVWKKHKIKAGSYGNFPGGETFFTPGKMNGVFVGDLVICIDQSYEISEKKPFVIKVKNGFYKILSGEKRLLKKIFKRKKDAWKMIRLFEKHKSLPSKIIKSYKKNFERIGEFAINTNPHAKKSRYLIEMEKMAKMMHIALGSGFEPKRETTYHMDIVINAPRQKMNIYGITKQKEKLWIMKKGKLMAK